MKSISQNFKILFVSTLCFFITSLFLILPGQAFALDEKHGKDLFFKHCAGCHLNGGNIVRRNKTLKMKDLKRNGLDNEEAIARIAKEGIGIMSGYEEYLTEGDDLLVASWIWNQAQKAWIHG